MKSCFGDPSADGNRQEETAGAGEPDSVTQGLHQIDATHVTSLA